MIYQNTHYIMAKEGHEPYRTCIGYGLTCRIYLHQIMHPKTSSSGFLTCLEFKSIKIFRSMLLKIAQMCVIAHNFHQFHRKLNNPTIKLKKFNSLFYYS